MAAERYGRDPLSQLVRFFSETGRGSWRGRGGKGEKGGADDPPEAPPPSIVLLLRQA